MTNRTHFLSSLRKGKTVNRTTQTITKFNSHMEIKPKPRPLHTLNSNTRTYGSFYIRDGSRNFNTPEKLSYSIEIGYGSPSRGSVCSLLKPTRHYRRLQPEQVVLRSKDSRSKPPLVMNFYIVNNTLHSG